MPRIPTYNAGATVERQVLPNARVVSNQPTFSADMFGADQGREMQQAGKAMQAGGGNMLDIAIDHQKTVNADRMLRAETLFNDKDAQYRLDLESRKGIQANGAREDAVKWHDEQQRKVMESLENDAQRTAMGKVLAQRRTQLVTFAGAHQFKELRVAEMVSLDASTNSAINAAAAANGSPEVLAMQRSTIERNLARKSQRMGWAKETYEAERMKANTELHGTVIKNLIDRDPRAAKTYLEQYGSEMDEAKKNPLADAVKRATLDKDAEDMAKITAGKGLSGGLDAIKAEKEKVAAGNAPDKEYRLDVLEKAAALHKKDFAERETIKTANQRNAAEQAWDMFDKKQKVPNSVLEAMDPQARVAFKKRLEGGDGEGKVKTDWAAYALLRDTARKDPEKFAKLDIYKYFGKLADKDRETLLDLQGQITKAASKPDKEDKIAHIQSLETFVTNYAASNKLYASGDTKENYYAFENTVKANLQQIARERGVAVDRLTDKDRTDAADKAVMKVPVPGRLFGTNEVPMYEARKNMAKVLTDVPEKDRARLRDKYERETGFKAASGRIIELYNAEKGI